MLLDFNVIPFKNKAVNETILVNGEGLSISGKVLEKNISIPCVVRLYEKLSGRLLSEVLTDNQGFYKFNGLTAVKFFIIAHHPTSSYNAIIQDNIIPK